MKPQAEAGARVRRKELFELPDGVVYLDGNSLGPAPKSVAPRIAQMLKDEWAADLITGWNQHGWMDQPRLVGDLIAPIIGARPGSVIAGDTLSIKIHQALGAALALRPERRIVLSDHGNFPTDLYMAESLLKTLDRGHELRLVAPDEIEDAIDASVAAVMLTHVDYRSGRMHDLTRLSTRAESAGAVMIWDLAHSAGALPVDIEATGAAFAAGCTYKYLNGGPGAPAFIYVRSDLIEQAEPLLAGWMGHAAPFAFEEGYRAAPSIERMRVGTPPVIQMTALEEALGLWSDVDLDDLRAASIALSERLITGVEARCPELTLTSPRDPHARGSHVSFSHSEGYAIIQALIARGVIGDFRAPNLLRFGLTPLYLSLEDIDHAVDALAIILRDRVWDAPEFKRRARVT